jgi:hypothetical protein
LYVRQAKIVGEEQKHQQKRTDQLMPYGIFYV